MKNYCTKGYSQALKKCLMTLMLIIATVTIVVAQEQPKARKRHFSPEEFQAKQKSHITEKAELTQEEADAFFPLFFELQKKKFELERNARKDFRKQPGEKMTEEEFSRINDGLLKPFVPYGRSFGFARVFETERRKYPLFTTKTAVKRRANHASFL